MHSVRAIQNAAKSIGLFSRYSSTDTIGFIGLGAMGSNMVSNLTSQGRSVIAYDVNKQAVQNIASKEVVIAVRWYQSAIPFDNRAFLHSDDQESVASVVQKSSIIITMLPNDKIVTDVSNTILESASSRKIIHISCSTISPVTSRLLKDAYSLRGSTFIAAPVFARPDGIAKRQATWMIAGEDAGRHEASVLLGTMGKVVDYGPDVGAANVAKLCGNFLIAVGFLFSIFPPSPLADAQTKQSSIEAIAESMALAEKHGVDRTAVMQLLSSTIFDCLIYKVCPSTGLQ